MKHISLVSNAAWRPAVGALAFTLLLAACGGGDPADANKATTGVSDLPPEKADAGATPRRVRAMGVSAGTNIPVDAHLKGAWSPLKNWPLIAVHAVLMPDGRVLTYGTKTDGQQTGYFQYDLWDSTQDVAAGHTTIANGTGVDIFCSSQLVLPQSGSAVFIAGGDNWTGTGTTNTGNPATTLFNGGTNTLTRANDLGRPRWYSSSTTLINGETYVQGGSGGTDRPEIRARDGSFRLLGAADTSTLNFFYPRNFVAPDGRVFGFDTQGRMYFVNTTTGALVTAGQFKSAFAKSTSSAAMFRPGRILQFGGNSNGAIVIDITSGSPVVTQTQSMSSQRQWVTGTLLADGKVLATGGSQVDNELTGVNNIAEIWDPQTGAWSQGHAGAVARLYHSNALLLPDATVLVAGGGAPGPYVNLNAEIYHPPYLFSAGGVEAPRPSILTTPDYLSIGKTFDLGVSAPLGVSRVVLVKTGSTTHSWNMEQRFVELGFKADGNTLHVQAPARAADAPPGYYMVFVIDANGVPSVAKILLLGVAPDPNPQVVPVLGTPGNQTNGVGANVDLPLVASDPNGDKLSFVAAGLPPGLTLSAATGRITGSPTTTGSYNVVLSVSDGYNVASVNLLWTVTGAVPVQFDVLPLPQPVLSGAGASFNAHAVGTGVQYKWSFGDGSAETAWASSGGASHTYARAGSFYVTVSARDDHGVVVTQSFWQLVYLPLTAGGPTASTNLLSETSAAGVPRLWVVNQDGNSVSVFHQTTRARLAVVPVGAAPRTIARAANGQMWVTNKRDATLSVIDPVSLTVSRTIALPRASQPFGVVMNPSGTQAFVVLEAGGQLLRFDTASFAQTGALAIGLNARHAAVSGDGTQVHVSRFVTPALPGEATATVTPTAATGGQVLVVSASAMTLQRTTILQHSDKPDFENQGRGIPNYLGAVAISPDGTQAWVPSKQDNVLRGTRRDGNALNFQSTVRAVSSRINLATGLEDLAARVDHDNASMASAALFDPRGVYLFVALETSREVAVVDAHARVQLMRFDVGRAPQGLALSPDGRTLYVNNFMDRSVGVFDLKPLIDRGELNVPNLTTLSAVATETLSATVLQGKQLFYDARDTRLARDRYMSCAACHNDGGSDGRVWDLSSQGEGLRNTIQLRGRAGAQGLQHWSANFDEVQDFEGQIRTLAGGTGLMTDAAYNTGTRSQPLGDRKAGASADLDALAAYVASLSSFDNSPYRTATGVLSTAATAGKAIFQAQNCAACHSGTAFTGSGTLGGVDIGTLTANSGQRLGGALTGLDVPTLRDVWATAPYLHDGSAATLEGAVAAHKGVALNATDLASLAAYLREVGAEEGTPPAGPVGSGTGLTGKFFNNTTLSGTAVWSLNSAVDADIGTASPSPSVNADNFSVRWTGQLLAPTSGLYQMRTLSDDGVRLWVNGVLLIDNWTDHAVTTNTSAAIALSAGQRVEVKLEYYDRTGGAVIRFQWLPPGATSFAAVPAAQLFPSELPVVNGLTGQYFANTALSGSPVLTRYEAVDFGWGTASPGSGVPADGFSVRWSGTVAPSASGTHYFQTVSDDGVRVWVNGVLMINNWTNHSATTNTSGGIYLAAGSRYTVVIEYYDYTSSAQMRFRWRTPGAWSYTAVPLARLYSR